MLSVAVWLFTPCREARTTFCPVLVLRSGRERRLVGGMASFEGKTVPGSGPVHFKWWVNRKAEGRTLWHRPRSC